MALNLLLQLLFGTWVIEGSCAEVVGGFFHICGVAIILIRESQCLDCSCGFGCFFFVCRLNLYPQ